MRWASLLAASLTLVVATTGLLEPSASRAVSGVLAPDVGCTDRPGATRAARQVMDDEYQLGPHPLVRLPHVLTWAEDPLRDRNWQYQFQSLAFLLPLLQRTRETGDTAYRRRAMTLARSWSRAAARDTPPSPFTWFEHSVALRAVVLVCLARTGPPRDWLVEQLRIHASLLDDPWFMAAGGNHRLDDAIGLLMIGCHLRRDGWTARAATRINATWPTLVDAQGATTEASTWYASYAYQRGGRAMAALRACHRRVGSAFTRRAGLPRFLALATDPDGYATTLGDTLHVRALAIPGTAAEYAATAGDRGRVPSVRAAVYRAGYLFSRTGWGTRRPARDERAMTLRFGAARGAHAHEDAGSLTLFGFGRRLLVDPGMWGYEPREPERAWIKSRAAHNVVTIDGLRVRDVKPRVIRTRLQRRGTEAVLSLPLYRGVSIRRRVLFSTREGYLVVEDVVRSSKPVTVRQLWHLMPGTRPVTVGRRTWTRSTGGNVLIAQLGNQGASQLIRGELDPRQGWVEDGYRSLVSAPVLSQRSRGTTVRYLTLIVPFRSGTPSVQVSRLRMTADGFSMTVRIGGRTERIRATATGASITD